MQSLQHTKLILMIRFVNLLISEMMDMTCVHMLDLLKEIPLKINVGIYSMCGLGEQKQPRISVLNLQ